uniref:C2H2-type domain-containing protein n=1 Tax=Romanomermis culicivorax TaxID=13658 RepID=A0A915IL41_ROMCU
MAQQRYCTANVRHRNFQLCAESASDDAEFTFCGATAQILPESPKWFQNTAFVDEVSTSTPPYGGHNMLRPTCYQTSGHHYLLDLNVGPCVQGAVQQSAFQGPLPTVSLYHHYHHHHHHVTSYGTLDAEIKPEDQYRANTVDEYKPTLTQLTARVPANFRNIASTNTGISPEVMTNYPVNEGSYKSCFPSKRKNDMEKMSSKLVDVRNAAAAGLITAAPKRRNVAATSAVKFQCFICGNNYCRQSTLKAHMRQHSVYSFLNEPRNEEDCVFRQNIFCEYLFSAKLQAYLLQSICEQSFRESSATALLCYRTSHMKPDAIFKSRNTVTSPERSAEGIGYHFRKGHFVMADICRSKQKNYLRL